MTVDEIKHMVKTYGIEHTLQRIDVDEVEDQELRTLFNKMQKLNDDINARLFLDTSDWYSKIERT